MPNLESPLESPGPARGSTLEPFQPSASQAIASVADKPPKHWLVLVKYWNEWAKGNDMELDLRHGHACPEALRNEIVAVDTVK